MRLQPLKESDLVGDQVELWEALVSKSVRQSEKGVLDEHGAVRGPLGVLLRHPPTGRPLQQLASVLRYEGGLSDAAREAVILVVAAQRRDPFEWSSHEPIARRAGMSDEQLAALRNGDPVSFDDPVTQAACDAARAIMSRGDLDDAEYARAVDVLGEEQLVELTVLIGYYALLSMQLLVFRVPVPEW